MAMILYYLKQRKLRLEYCRYDKNKGYKQYYVVSDICEADTCHGSVMFKDGIIYGYVMSYEEAKLIVNKFGNVPDRNREPKMEVVL